MISQQSEEYRTTLARERSHQDIVAANEYRRSLIQVAVIINGGAATAILTYYGSAKIVLSNNAMAVAAISLLLYYLGIFFAALAAYFYGMSVNNWAQIWEKRAYWQHQAGNECAINILENGATKYGSQARYFLFIGIICFPVASFAMALSLYLAMVNSNQSKTSITPAEMQSVPNNQPNFSTPQTSKP